MGPTELPTQSTDVVKIPTAHYEFGANFIDPKVCIWYYPYLVSEIHMIIWVLEQWLFPADDAFWESNDRR